MNFRKTAQALAAFAALFASAPTFAVEVTASIAPIHSVVARVMAGVGAPHLLVPPGASPHGFTLRPSDARALDQADVVFWVGEGLEAFLVRPISALAADAVVVELGEADGVEHFPYREGGPWEGHGEGEAEGGHGHGHDHGHDHGEGAFDAHVWLDPKNAAAMAATVADTLAAVDPPNAEAYRGNARQFAQEIDGLTAEIAGELAGVGDVAFIVFHDAYQYFERRFGLNVVGSLLVNPDAAPSAKRLAEIRARLAEKRVACVFAEPQFDQRLARVVVEGSQARLATMDPLGVDIATGAGLYPELIRNLARSIKSCAAA